MNWIPLEDLKQLSEISSESHAHPVIIYKHSTRCSISRAALDRLNRQWDHAETGNAKRYVLDLLAYRDISNQIADTFAVEHESPQVLIIRGGKSIADMSHFAIDFDAVKKHLKTDNDQ